MQQTYQDGWNAGFDACVDIISPVIKVLPAMLTAKNEADFQFQRIKAIAVVGEAIAKLDEQIAKGKE